MTLSLGTPGEAIPDRSPLTSARNTGTPAADSCSAISCSVLVLPVPVAPATRPCRLSISSGIRTPTSGWEVLSVTNAPSSRDGAVNAYPALTLATMSDAESLMAGEPNGQPRIVL